MINIEEEFLELKFLEWSINEADELISINDI